jgi:hypothetical protein
MVKVATMFTILACKGACARRVGCENSVSLYDGSGGGCTHYFDSPTIVQNPEIKIGNFRKESECGSHGSVTTWEVVLTCNGQDLAHMPKDTYPGHLDIPYYRNTDGDSVDIAVHGSWTCEGDFGIDLYNRNSAGGFDSCSEHFLDYNITIEMKPFLSCELFESAGAARIGYDGSVSLYHDGQGGGCTHHFDSPTVVRNPETKIGNFRKESECGSHGYVTTWEVVLTCNGQDLAHMPKDTYPGHLDIPYFRNTNGDSVDRSVEGSWTCEGDFGIYLYNRNSAGGFDSCSEAFLDYKITLDQVALDGTSPTKGELEQLTPSSHIFKTADAGRFGCGNSNTIPDGQGLGCTHHFDSPTIVQNLKIKIDNFQKESGCGSHGYVTTWEVVMTCNGQDLAHMPKDTYPGHLDIPYYRNTNGDSVDRIVEGSWTCEGYFGIHLYNRNSAGGFDSCSETFWDWDFSVEIAGETAVV